nr:MATE family efflux transporter [uncultured Lachnoclostridium sp.]
MDENTSFFGTENTGRLLLRLAPPVMLAQLIQALYNIVDSYFIGQYSQAGLAALSVIFPVQLLISAVAIGTGVGVNTLMSKYCGLGQAHKAAETAGVGLFLAIAMWAVSAVILCGIMDFYTGISLSSQQAQEYACTYGRIVCGFSFGIFLESGWTKVLQSRGDMKTPMVAQLVGAGINIVLDWLLIFGIGFFPELGVAGAAIATAIGQIAAVVITGSKAFHRIPGARKIREYTGKIYRAGFPNMLMNGLCTIYIVALNLILVSFSDEAVTVLGLYYKLQSFILIPALGLTTCIIPILSYNYAAGNRDRCTDILRKSIAMTAVCMAVGALAFEAIPRQLLSIFAADQPAVLDIGTTAFRIIGASFIPIAVSLVIPNYFQAIGKGKQSIALALLRQIGLLIPLAWCLSFIGLTYVWLAFPISEVITAAASCVLYRRCKEGMYKRET